jgi:Outer membrane protein beta-barrel domain
MKKLVTLFLSIILVGVVNVAMSQVQLALGLKGGLNFAKLDVSGTASSNYENKTGFHGGGFLLIKLTKIGIQPEILFSKQGSSLKFSGIPTLESNIDYINVPIMLKLYTVAGINIQAGPQFGFVASAKQDVLNATTGKITTEDIKDQLKGYDLSLGLGLGWDAPFGLTFDARYNLGLSKINDASGSPESKNQVIQVSVGYKLFKFGK